VSRAGRVGDCVTEARAQVLIVGAGPTGLVMALWLTRLGVRVRIVDKTAEPGTTSRAVAVQARTLEFYRQIGLADAVVARGHHVSAANMWVAGRHVARAVFGDMGAGISPYAYAFIFTQDEHERLLIDTLCDRDVSVERQTELIQFEEREDRVVAKLRHPDGRLKTATPRSSSVAMVRTRVSARSCRLVSLAAPTSISSTSPMSKRAVW